MATRKCDTCSTRRVVQTFFRVSSHAAAKVNNARSLKDEHLINKHLLLLKQLKLTSFKLLFIAVKTSLYFFKFLGKNSNLQDNI